MAPANPGVIAGTDELPRRAIRCAIRGTGVSPGWPAAACSSCSESPGTWPARSSCRPSTTWPTAACCRRASRFVGFASRDWEDEDFAQLTYEAVKEYARTPFRDAVWQQLSEGVRFVSGSFDDDAAFDELADTVMKLDAERGTGGNYAFYLSIPPGQFPDRGAAAQAQRSFRFRGSAAGGGW